MPRRSARTFGLAGPSSSIARIRTRTGWETALRYRGSSMVVMGAARRGMKSEANWLAWQSGRRPTHVWRAGRAADWLDAPDGHWRHLLVIVQAAGQEDRLAVGELVQLGLDH